MESVNEEPNSTTNDPAAQAAPAAKAPRKRAPRKSTAPASTVEAAPPAGPAAAAVSAADAPEASGQPSDEPAPAPKTTRRRASAKKAAPAAGVPGDGAAAAEDAVSPASAETAEPATKAEPAEKPVRRRASRAKKPAEAPAADAAAEAPATGDSLTGAAATIDASADEAADDTAVAPKAARTRKAPVRRTRKAAAVDPSAPAEGNATDATADAEPPAATEAGGGAAQDAPTDGFSARDAAAEPAVEEAETVADPFAVPSAASLLFHAPDLTAVVAPSRTKPAADEGAEGEEDESEGRGRRSRSRRGRGRTRDESAQQESGDAAAESEGGESGPAAEGDGVVSRRRRRRRRGDADLELTGGQDDDPPNTVTRVRGPRQAAPEAAPSNKVTSVKGSTRLEAKRQRRRESRETGRRRHVITEAEFLARRESVDRQMIVRQREDRIQIGVLEDGMLAEHFVSKTQQDSLIGNVYVGKVQNVLPSMEAAFVDIGRGRNAVLYAGEVNWDVAGLDGQPRRIEHALKSGDSVLVQVTKDPVGHKGARLTSQISLPGRYLVYVPGGSMTGISRKLPDVERNRLKKILKDHLPENAGVIVRTAAEGASEQELMNDINRLRAQWEEIERKSTSNKTTPPELLYGEPDLTIKVVRDVFNEDFSKLIVSGEEAWDTIEAYVTYVAPDLLSRLEQWTAEEDIFTAHRLDEQIHKALERKVFLPSGGSLVIDRTEAMTVVDVNTGKFTGSGGNLEETVTKNNLEAAEEIVRQLRLRDIGGIIVIDFIDMVLEANRDLVLRRMVECLGRDRTKHQVAEVTSLGLVQMTRKRMGTGLLEVFSENCEACNGRGVVTHEEPVEHRRAYTAQGEPQGGNRGDRGAQADRAPRGDRKRRGRGQDREADASTEPLHVAPVAAADPEREAKATAARAAFASIAAAAHAAHEHELQGNRAVRPETPATPEPSRPVEAAEPAAVGEEQDEEQVVTIAGEEVRLPRSRRRRRASSPTHAPELTLEGLSAAFAAPGTSPGAPAQEPGTERDAHRPGSGEGTHDRPETATAETAEPVAGPDAGRSPEAGAATAPRASRRSRGSRRATDSGKRSDAAAEPAAQAPHQAASGDEPTQSRRERSVPEPSAPVSAIPESAVPERAEAPASGATAAGPAADTRPGVPASSHTAEQSPRRVRRTRSARSAQGSANEPIERSAGDTAQRPAGEAVVAHVAKLPARAARARQDSEAAAAPMILGVGVPASEL
ncbi:Rne/Rng family ribonuclease [Arthrobacter halodurans]|uniref:Rne/Rng family ribonuclease n=1 Tax=Arthrobacter halodurans TaxID=516699 RepID=A0ABV4UHV9_9MICC